VLIIPKASEEKNHLFRSATIFATEEVTITPVFPQPKIRNAASALRSRLCNGRPRNSPYPTDPSPDHVYLT
jgi:hypothetical protein